MRKGWREGGRGREGGIEEGKKDRTKGTRQREKTYTLSKSVRVGGR